VDDVAADTRIRATLIVAIEADQFALCGGTVYARGHIRSIARVVGVDAEALIGEFDSANQVERVVAAVASGPTDRALVARSEHHAPNWTAAAMLALVVICGLALAGILHGHNNGGKPNPTAGVNHSRAGHKSSVKTPVSPPPSAVAQLPVDQATMEVRTRGGRTWMSITTKGGKTLFLGTLNPGQQKVFTARRGLVFDIGNAPAVDVVVNGHDIGSPPSSGLVSKGNVIPGADTVQQA